jgi:hypothetical protein
VDTLADPFRLVGRLKPSPDHLLAKAENLAFPRARRAGPALPGLEADRGPGADVEPEVSAVFVSKK